MNTLNAADPNVSGMSQPVSSVYDGQAVVLSKTELSHT